MTSEIKPKDLRGVLEIAMSAGWKISVPNSPSGPLKIRLSKGVWLGRQIDRPDGSVDYAD